MLLAYTFVLSSDVNVAFGQFQRGKICNNLQQNHVTLPVNRSDAFAFRYSMIESMLSLRMEGGPTSRTAKCVEQD